LAKGYMHAPFVAGDTQGDARIAFTGCLGVTARGGAGIQLARLGLVAGDVFVADGHRYQAQPADHLGKRLVLAYYAEHSEDRRIGTVVSILGAPFGLGDPDRLAFFPD